MSLTVNFNSTHAHCAVELSLNDFKTALDDMVADWYIFGTALGIELKILDRMQYRYDPDRYMIAMLEMWLSTKEATWEKLQIALKQIGKERLAHKLEEYKEGQSACSITFNYTCYSMHTASMKFLHLWSVCIYEVHVM